jgi:hypothetical protein
MLESFDAEEFLHQLSNGAFDHRLHESLRELTQQQLEQVARLMTARLKRHASS